MPRAARPTIPDIEAAALVADYVVCRQCNTRAPLSVVLTSRESARCPICSETMVFSLHAPSAVQRESA